MEELLNKEFLEKLIAQLMFIYENHHQMSEEGTLQKHVAKLGETFRQHLQVCENDLNQFGETGENKSLKTEYIKATFIYDDLIFYKDLLRTEAEDAETLVKKYQYVKGIMLPLSLLSKNLKTWSKYSNGNQKLIVLQKVLRENLKFANHIRNKITGHLENEVLANSVQWEPLIFHEVSKDDKSAQRLVMYRSLLEIAINSYQDERTGRQKVFQKEIDLNLPYYAEMFFEHLFQMVDESVDYLIELRNTIDAQIRYFSGIPLDLTQAVSKTDFKLKAKGR